MALPPNCPVKPLGHTSDGAFFLCAQGETRFIPFSPNDADRSVIEMLFIGRLDYLFNHWPRKDRLGRPKSDYNANAARRDLTEVALLAGPYLLNIHPDNLAIDRFAEAMKAKMKIAREEKGRSGWEACEPDYLWGLLDSNVHKGDPVDVANFAMMIWNIAHSSSPAIAGEVARAVAPEGAPSGECL